MPVKKGLKPYAKKTELTKELRPRLEIMESVLMNAAPKWNGKKFTTSMTIKEACEKEGISDLTLRNWRQENPKLGEYWVSVMESRKQMLHDMLSQAALQNVMEVIGGGVKVRPMDKANLSMRYLQQTDSSMNPGLKVNIDNKTLNISMGSEEMEQRVMEIAAALNINNLKEYANSTSTISTNSTQESTGDGETSRFEGSRIIEYASPSEGTTEG